MSLRQNFTLVHRMIFEQHLILIPVCVRFAIACILAASVAAHAANETEGIAFFEAKIRPCLASIIPSSPSLTVDETSA